jgi:hypothetical protein
VIKEEWDESNISEFTRLVEQREQTWKPAAEELETINVGSDQFKKELKIDTLITAELRTKNDRPITGIYRCLGLVL